MSDLKPCPFCGKPAKWEKKFLIGGIARCSDYQCIGEFTHLSRSASSGEWNTRPAEDAKDKELTEQAANYENIICEYKRDVKQAVEQIDTLTAEVERLKGELADRDIEGYAGFVIGVDQMKKKLAEKDKEIERLKEALEKIYHIGFGNAPDKVAREFIKTVVHGAIHKTANAPDMNDGKMEEK